MNDLTVPLVDECHRQSETCLFTAVTFTIWLRWLRAVRLFFVVAPVVFGALATWKILVQTSTLWASVFTLLATGLPPVYRAMRVDKAIRDYGDMSAVFTNLRDRFRQAALIHSLKPFEEFEREANRLLDKLDKARKGALTPPEFIFWLARRKVKAGHYHHDHDAELGAKAE